MKTSKELNARRKMRVRTQIRKKAGGRPRLSVFRSSKHIYVQVIDDQAGRTLAAASILLLGACPDREHDELQFDVFRGTTSVDPTKP